MLTELPDDVWDIVLRHLYTDALAWQQMRLRGVSRLFRTAFPAFVGRTPAIVNYPGLCVHAAASLSLLLRLPVPPTPLPGSLRAAVRRRCALCGRRFAGKFVHFCPGLAIYAHQACVRSRCVASYWVEHPHDAKFDDPDLYAACVLAPAGATAHLPRWECHGYRRGSGYYSYSLLFVKPVGGVVPPEATVWGALRADQGKSFTGCASPSARRRGP